MKPEVPPFNMIVEGGRLVPATAYDQERLDSYRRGTKIKVRFTEEKDRVLVRKWWAVLGLVVKQCKTPWKNKDEASEAVKLALGIVNLTKTVGGDYLAYPKSLTELQDPELQDAVEQMTELLSRLTGVDVATLKKETAHVGHDDTDDIDPATGEIIPKDSHPGEAVPSSSPADDGPQQPSSEAADIPPLAASSIPDDAGNSLPAHEGSVDPSTSLHSAEPSTLFPAKFNIPAIELQHLKDFARKALNDAASNNDVPAKESLINRMTLMYRDAVESKDAREAIEAMAVPFEAVIAGKRTRAQAAAYISHELLSCAVEELEGRR